MNVSSKLQVSLLTHYKMRSKITKKKIRTGEVNTVNKVNYSERQEYLRKSFQFFSPLKRFRQTKLKRSRIFIL